ncbi:hypothetical protein F2P56_033422 [Juglans regia]|uniref:Uncharacterized protein n=1 Tax=Juglans regia TaxID=51240 RepID=A0A833TH90_JUGRE|nr:hypothetical protein F2P56_033422 [Juglans regia]
MGSTEDRGGRFEGDVRLRGLIIRLCSGLDNSGKTTIVLKIKWRGHQHNQSLREAFWNKIYKDEPFRSDRGHDSLSSTSNPCNEASNLLKETTMASVEGDVRHRWPLLKETKMKSEEGDEKRRWPLLKETKMGSRESFGEKIEGRINVILP